MNDKENHLKVEMCERIDVQCRPHYNFKENL